MAAKQPPKLIGYLHHRVPDDPLAQAVSLLEHLDDRTCPGRLILNMHHSVVHLRIECIAWSTERLDAHLGKNVVEILQNHFNALFILLVGARRRERPLDRVHDRQKLRDRGGGGLRVDRFLLPDAPLAEVVVFRHRAKQLVVQGIDLLPEEFGLALFGSGLFRLLRGGLLPLLRLRLRGRVLRLFCQICSQPISVIVIDYFHWPLQGDWKFDEKYWPDPDAMIQELKEMGIELMVSIWPTVDYRSENFQEMKEKGYLIRTDRGFRIVMDFQGNTVHYDATNPAAREYVWQKAKKNYYDKGIKVFWLDEAEPEYSVYDFDNYRYHMGPNVQVGNIYPALYAKTFFDGMKAEGQENIINLLRCAWAGSQKYGALVWSGDIHSSFSSLRNQLAAGLNMGLAGIPWWTTDIGGFHGGDPKDPKFQELLVRWFEYGTFCPVMRLHGYREPLKEPMGKEGGAACVSGADNEVWSFGEEAYEICKKYLALCESMKPYITELMEAAHEKGTPVMRPLFYDFPKDSKCWEIEDQYMFGPDVLVAPVTYADMRKRTIYLPEGSQWTNFDTEEIYEGGQVIEVDAPLSQIPVFTRNGRKLK